MATLEEFKQAAGNASYHYADDTCREWDLAEKYEHQCRRIFEEADEALKAEIRKVAGSYLIGRWWADQ
jgi:hypothetical protein